MAPEGGAVARDQAPTAVDRREVVTGQVFITTPDPIGASRDAATLVEGGGGRVDNRTENAETDFSTASSSLTARIPADDLDGVVDSISALGEVTSIGISRDDVTMQYRDLDARAAALQSSVDRLRSLIAGATSTADLIEAESALSTRQGELDSLTSQRDYLAEQVELSTITIQFDTVDATPSPGPDNFVDGIVAGWHSLVAAGKAAVIGLGRAIPWLGVLVVAAGLVYAAIRGVARRSGRAGQPTVSGRETSADADDHAEGTHAVGNAVDEPDR